MGFSLAIHIIFASLGVSLPVIILLLEFIGIRKNDNDYKRLAKKLTLIFMVLFAIGTASGALVASELFLLWPKFAVLLGQVAITPIYVEVFAFFSEAIFLGIYVYSWDKFKWKYGHVLTGVPIAIGGALSAVLITIVNAFMNNPVGFNIKTYLSNGTVTGIQPFAVFTSPPAVIEFAHVLFSAYFAGTMIVLAYVIVRLLGSGDGNAKAYYSKALNVILAIAIIAATLTIITGIKSIESLAVYQPEKYAALEANLHGGAYAPEVIGGFAANNSTSLVDYVDLPDLQSILLGGTANTVVPGLNSYPKSTWPPLIVHPMFDLMFFLGVGIGLILALIVVLHIIGKKPLGRKPVLYLLFLCAVAAVLLLENGWIMAEVARQPWIVYNVMTVAQAANQSPGILPIAVLLFAFYILIIPFSLMMMKRILKNQNL